VRINSACSKTDYVVFSSVNDGTGGYIASGRESLNCNRIRVEFQFHHFFCLSGTKVTNLVLPGKCSIIQIARTLRAAPLRLAHF
jgi:hypothetical protein